MPDKQDGHQAMNIAANTPLSVRNYDYDTRRYASSISSSSSSSRSITPTFESCPIVYDQQQEIDGSPAEPDEFILTVLKKPQDRIFLLSLERDFELFLNDPKPPIRLPDLVEQEQLPADAMPQIKIMRRTPLSNSPRTARTANAQERKTMTLEERKVAYEKARARIFQDLEKPSE
ncbi:hypothetical protein DFQ28_001107 [Apophysomyces sp. BC1034]|nr:hypothetical protein DFQ28_001107 [Apophysomyces sp. BC1034]